MGEYIFHYPLPQVSVSCLSGTRRWLSDRPRHPFGSPTFELVSYVTLAGRGGSVSRRDHNQAAGKPHPLSGGTKPEEAIKPNASYSSGEGVWGRGASLREAASPPEYPHFPFFCNFGLDKLHLRAIMQRIQQGRCEVTLAVSFSLFCWYSAGSCAILAGL